MKKIKILFIISFIFLKYNIYAFNKIIRVGVSKTTYPFCYLDNKDKKIKGYSVDVFDSICSKLNLNYVYVPLDNNNFDYTSYILKNDSVDLILNATYFIKDKSLNYSFPYFYDNVSLFSYKKFSQKERSLSTNKKIGFFYKELKNLCDSIFPDRKDNFILFENLKNFSDRIKIMKERKCDAFLCNKIPFTESLKNNHMDSLFYSYDINLLYEKHALAVKKENIDLLNKIDKEMLDIVSPSLNEKLYKKWIRNDNEERGDKFLKILYISLIIFSIYMIYILIFIYIKYKKRKSMISYFSMLLNAVPYPIVIRNAYNLNEIIFSNTATFNILGTSEKLDFKKVLSDDTIKKLREKNKSVVTSEKSYFGLEKYEFLNGEINYFNVKRNIIKIEDLKLLIITRYNVNDLVYNTLKSQKAEKLKSVFLSNMSHEIRTPLNAIVGFSRLLIEEEDLCEIKKYKDIIKNNTNLLLQLITDVIDLSQLESGIIKMDFQWYNFKDLMNEFFIIYKHNIKKTGKDIILNFDDMYDFFDLYVDKRCITQIITNFLNNAVKYTLEGYIQFGYYVYNGATYIYVKDTGIGIPQDKIKFVFQRFEKLSNIAAGSGLGMSISSAITSAMNGKIYVKSKEDKGSIFWVKLPLKYKKRDKVNTRFFSAKENIKKIRQEINDVKKNI